MATCRKKNLPLEALKYPWPGEKKGSHREKDRKSTRNQAKSRNHLKIEALYAFIINDFSKVKAIPLP